MTLQQEIIDALRDAQQEINTLRYHAGLSSTNYRFEQLAARVEKARCELCKKYFMATSKDMEGIPCPWAGSGGCWEYEPKEKVNL